MLFPTECDIQGTIEVLEYGGEAYLMFLEDCGISFSDHKMTFYWLRDGIPCGKMDFWYQCRGMDVQVLEDSGVYDLGALDGKWMDIYHEAAGWRQGKNETELAEYFSRFGGGMRGYTLTSAYYFEGDIDNDGMPEVYAKETGHGDLKTV